MPTRLFLNLIKLDLSALGCVGSATGDEFVDWDIEEPSDDIVIEIAEVVPTHLDRSFELSLPFELSGYLVADAVSIDSRSCETTRPLQPEILAIGIGGDDLECGEVAVVILTKGEDTAVQFLNFIPTFVHLEGDTTGGPGFPAVFTRERGGGFQRCIQPSSSGYHCKGCKAPTNDCGETSGVHVDMDEPPRKACNF